MKSKYVFLFIVAVTCSALAGCGSGTPSQIVPLVEEVKQPISFLHDHATGFEVARQKRMPTLTFFSIPDNIGSQRMMETTFRDDEIKRLSEWLVCIQVDGTQESALCESLAISSFPTIILSNAKGSEVRRLVGRQTSDQLAVQIHILLQSIALHPQTVAGMIELAKSQKR
jgi:hypothetical protein